MKKIMAMFFAPLLIMVCAMFATATAVAYTDATMSADSGYSSPAVMPALDVAGVSAAIDGTGERQCLALAAEYLTPTTASEHPETSGGTSLGIASNATGVRLQV